MPGLAFLLYFPWVQKFFPPHPPPRNSEQLLEKPESVERSGAGPFCQMFRECGALYRNPCPARKNAACECSDQHL